MAECNGNAWDHCCYLGEHGICEFLEENAIPERKWSCMLRRTLGNWERVHLDPRYLDRVRPKLNDIGIDQNCGDWPRPGERCATCGVMGDG